MSRWVLSHVVVAVLLLPSSVVSQSLVGWSTVETEHFRFHFPPQPHANPATFPSQMEGAYVELHAVFGGVVPGRINYYVWNSHTEGEGLLGRSPGFARPDLLLVHATADQTPGHELTHVLVHHAVRPEATTRFIAEGTAAAFDLTKRDRLALARAALERMGATSPFIERLWQQGDRVPGDLLYPVAGAFVERLVARGGRERFLRLLKRQTLEEARVVYGPELVRIVADFEADLVVSASAGQPSAEPTLESLRTKAQERMRRDLESFSRQELREIESLYQSANRDLRAPGTRDSLLALVKKYPKANRSGCALLYLAQLSSGDELEVFLETAIADHGDAWYGDGTQVGAFARMQLAALYANAGRQAEATALAEEVRTKFPGAVDHGGGRLADTLRRLKLLP